MRARGLKLTSTSIELSQTNPILPNLRPSKELPTSLQDIDTFLREEERIDTEVEETDVSATSRHASWRALATAARLDEDEEQEEQEGGCEWEWVDEYGRRDDEGR